jgi:hypothetical protein
MGGLDVTPKGMSPDGRCTATSRTTGDRCGAMAIAGGAVCRYHGGGASQVKRKAQLRLLELVEPAIATLAREMATAEKSADRQRAANSILDRAGMPRTQVVDAGAAKDLLMARISSMRKRGLPATPSEDHKVIEQKNEGQD